jgi:hypothetical protein
MRSAGSFSGRAQALPGPILISSCSSQNAIHRQLRERLGLDNPVILLYGQ